jgi:hypothetical protein
VLYESRRHAPLPRRRFVLRLLSHALVACAVMGVSIGGGMLGYMHYESLPWRDAFLNSTMLLGGMGPVDAPKTDAGKMFAGWFALYSGLVFIVTLGLLLTPVVHRVLHRFHWDADS